MPTLPVCTRCRGEGHGHPRSISTELVSDGLSKRLGPVVHFRFDCRHPSGTQTEKIRTTSENRNFHSDGKPGPLEPSRDGFGQFGLEAERHARLYHCPKEKLLFNPARDSNGPRVRGCPRGIERSPPEGLRSRRRTSTLSKRDAARPDPAPRRR